MIWCECDFKDELNKDKEDTHGVILELYFDGNPTVGVDTFEGNDYGASEGLEIIKRVKTKLILFFLGLACS